MKRVKLNLLSGLYSKIYSDFKKEVLEKASKRNIPTREISFLYGTNFPKIETEITENERMIIRDTYSAFKTENQ